MRLLRFCLDLVLACANFWRPRERVMVPDFCKTATIRSTNIYPTTNQCALGGGKANRRVITPA